MACDLCACFTWFGAIAAGWIVLKFLLWVQLTFLQTNNLKRYLKAGKWAVVTGASDGIGKGFALELAKAGFNVALISRTKSKLEEVASECEKYKVETKIFPFDFSTATKLDYRKLGNLIEELSVGVLVNNVGINYEYPQNYEAVDIDEDLSLLKVNCESQLQMTKMVLPKMKKQRCGAIVNLSSYTVIAEVGMMTTYAATKAFNKTFSEALQTELSRDGIDVLAITPNMVISNMSKLKRESFGIVKARPMARQALNKIGAVASNAGHWQHAIIENITSWLPTSIRRGKVLGAMTAMKKKAEKKKAEGK
jgi:17beta-estradiol 17-dehydrogenase / very-long-chain 3-oxoacyl-CoA reductase